MSVGALPSFRRRRLRTDHRESSIDGVLLHSRKPIPGASEALNYLHEHSIPFILLTNGGGKPELDRAADISSLLAVPLARSQLVQSHTPFQALLDGTLDSHGHNRPSLRNRTVLVVGGDEDRCRQVAHDYGFENAVIPADIYVCDPDIWPFSKARLSYYQSFAKPLPKPLYTEPPTTPLNPQTLKKHLKIDAILVFNDSRDWGLDITLIHDLLLSHHGYLGTRAPTIRDPISPSSSPSVPQQNHKPPTSPFSTAPPLYFSNPDHFWRNSYHLPRFGQGALIAAFRAVLAQSGQSSWLDGPDPLHSEKRPPLPEMHVMGKPNFAAYHWAEHAMEMCRLEKLLPDERAERAMERLRGRMYAGVFSPRDSRAIDHRDSNVAEDVKEVEERDEGRAHQHPDLDPLRTVYMVGDNPASDIAGANKFRSGYRTEWRSLLVRTGIWQEGDELAHRPTEIRGDVLEAVRWAVEEEGRRKGKDG